MKSEIFSLKNSLIAPCGMNCGVCMAYLREKNKCNGCRLSDENKPNSCIKCIIKNCDLLQDTESNFCYDCPKYPCKRLINLDKRYRTKYRMSMLENLSYIKSEGLDQFVEKESNRWICPNCGETVSVHRSFCLKCKTDLVIDSKI